MIVKNVKYVIITPVRDEEKYIQETIDSVVAQSILPIEWIIVNDGSRDSTATIINNNATKYSWINVIHRQDRGFRKAGGGVVEAFYEGYKHISSSDWHFLVKLDADLKFDSNYFERCFSEFGLSNKLGIGGGRIYNNVNAGKFELEKDPVFHVRGATKIYRKECWTAIGGLLVAPGWDTLDEVKANMLGWESRCFVDIHLVQLKTTGSADGAWANWVKNGRANYICGYHPLFMMLKCIKRLFQKPYFIVTFGLFYGFVQGYIRRDAQVDDPLLIRYLREQQLRKIMGKKTIWK